MKTILTAAFALAALASAAKADVIDMATVKCSDLATMSEEEGSMLFIWMHGYFGGQNGTTTMDTGAMGDTGNKIGEYCAANPDAGMLSAAKEAMGG